MEFVDDISKVKCEKIVEDIRSCCSDPEIENIISMLAEPLYVEIHFTHEKKELPL